jgi:chromosome partitioning protein
MTRKIIAVVNNKGGVGKTTVACNLGAALAQQQRRVLVLDLDSQCNATQLLLSGDHDFRHSLYELLTPVQTGPISLRDFILPAALPGLYCLPNVAAASGLEMDMLSCYPQSLQFLRTRARDFLLKNFDMVLMDNPPNLGMLVANSLYAADLALIPVDAGSAFSLAGVDKTLELIAAIQERGNPSLRFLGLLVNRVDRRTAVGRGLEEEIRVRFPQTEVLHTQIPVNTAVQRAEYRQKLLFPQHRASRAALAYIDLAVEIVARLGEKAA